VKHDLWYIVLYFICRFSINHFQVLTYFYTIINVLINLHCTLIPKAIYLLYKYSVQPRYEKNKWTEKFIRHSGVNRYVLTIFVNIVMYVLCVYEFVTDLMDLMSTTFA